MPWGDGIGPLDDPPQLWIVDLDTGAVEQLTADEWRWSRPRWSPDGTTLAVRVSHDPAGHRRGQHMRLVQLDGSWEAPPVPGGSYVVHDWSALGLLAVLVVQPTNRELGSQGQLHVIGPDGVRELTAAVPFGAGGDVYGDSPAALGDGYDAALAVDGATAWVRVTDGGRLGVARVGLTDEPPVWTQVVGGERCVTPVGVRGGRLVVAAQSATEPCRLVVGDGEGSPSSWRLLPAAVDEAGVTLPAPAEVHRFTVPSPVDGAVLEAWFLAPPGEAGGPLPTVLMVHGGPMAASVSASRSTPRRCARPGSVCSTRTRTGPPATATRSPTRSSTIGAVARCATCWRWWTTRSISAGSTATAWA